MPTATVAMPTATTPTSPKASGFTKPSGFGQSQNLKEDDDEEPKKDHPLVLGIAVLTLLLMAYVCYMQYGTDQMPGRQSDDMRVFGAPGAGDSGGSEDFSASASDDSGDEDADSSGDSDSSDDEPAEDSEDEE